MQLHDEASQLHRMLWLAAIFRLKGLRLLCRDDARNVLVAMMAEIGVQYLYYAIQTLHNACPAKGYTAHVLGYTLHSILHVLAQVHHYAFTLCSLDAALLRCMASCMPFSMTCYVLAPMLFHQVKQGRQQHVYSAVLITLRHQPASIQPCSMSPKIGVWPCIRKLHLALGVQGADPGALDGYLDSILPVMEADLFGDIAEAKEADAFAAKYRCSGPTTGVALQCPCLLQ